MKHVVMPLTLALALTCLFPTVSPVFAEPTNREEVVERIELNNASAEQLVATGAVDIDIAKRIVQLREDLGGFQAYTDLDELEIPTDMFTKLQYATTIQGIAADCNC